MASSIPSPRSSLISLNLPPPLSPRFFPAVAYLTTARVPLAILANAALAALLLAYTATTSLFLGRLREAEVERVQDRLAGAAMETCLAMTIFREDFTASFLT